MKVRDSGMPEEEMWSGFFDPEKILRTFGFGRGVKNIVEFGCGYGTFTLAAARLAAGTVHALDIEPEMVEAVRQGSTTSVRSCATLWLRGRLPPDSIDAALLFNVLHHEEPVVLMKEAYRILKAGGRLAVIHWNYDHSTPRGSAMEIRPHPAQCITWGRTARFTFDERERFDLPPYHYGLLLRKPFS